MAPDFILLAPDWVSLGQNYLVDFFLAFTFFTALCFAVLCRRLGHHRAAAAASAALGTALAVGLVAWEVQSGWRVRDLGPIAAGFTLIVLAIVIHQSIRKLGGDWAGGAVALGSAMLIGLVLDIPWLASNGTVSAVATLALLIGAGMWLLNHTRMNTATGSGFALPGTQRGDGQALNEARATQQQVNDIDNVQRVERQLKRSLDQLEQATRSPAPGITPDPGSVAPGGPTPGGSPLGTNDQIETIRRQLAELIPVEGQVTRRLADLRARAVLAEKGHLARLRKLTGQIPRMTPEQARIGAMQVRAAYKEAGFYRRIERLDAAAVEVERRVLQLTAQAETLARTGQIDHLHQLIQGAKKLQRQAVKLVVLIERDEAKLLTLVMREVRLNPGTAT